MFVWVGIWLLFSKFFLRVFEDRIKFFVDIVGLVILVGVLLKLKMVMIVLLFNLWWMIKILFCFDFLNDMLLCSKVEKCLCVFNVCVVNCNMLLFFCCWLIVSVVCFGLIGNYGLVFENLVCSFLFFYGIGVCVLLWFNVFG